MPDKRDEDMVKDMNFFGRLKASGTVLAVSAAAFMVVLTLVTLVSFAVMNNGLIQRSLERQEALLCVILVQPERRTVENVAHCFINTPRLEDAFTDFLLP